MNFKVFKDSWSVNSFAKRYEKGQINFDNPIQRGLVWDKKMSSLYVHSLLYDILIYQKPFLVSKKANGWDVLDGKQRGTSLIKYINNDYALTGLQKEPLIEVDGELYNINNKYFKQLPDELQWKILDFPIDMAVLDEAPLEMEALFFNRSNSGKAMSKLDLARSKNNAIETVKEISKHKLFEIMFSSKMLAKLPQDEIVVKTWQALNETEPDFSAKHFSEIMEDLTITEDDKAQINSLYDVVYDAYKILLMEKREVANAMLKKTHFLSYISFINHFPDSEVFAKWALEFFTNMPQEYVKVSQNDTVGQKNTAERFRIIKESIENF